MTKTKKNKIPWNKGKKTGQIPPNRILPDRPLTMAETSKRYREKRNRLSINSPLILCTCGCGQMIHSIRTDGKERRFKRGHTQNTKMLSPTEIKRRHKAKMRAIWAQSPKIPCTCGCGTMIPSLNTQGKPARFVRGHTFRLGKDLLTENEKRERGKRYIDKLKEEWLKTPKSVLCACGCGELIRPVSWNGKPIRFVANHNGRMQSRYINCAWCGKLFMRKSSRKKFCSKACANRRLKDQFFKCKRCGKEFHSRQLRIFCSRNCANKANKGKIKVLAEYICQRCGKSVRTSKPVYAKKYRYCRECHKIVTGEKIARWSKEHTGINSPGYLHGKGNEPYPEEWRVIRKRIRKRDKETCQKCGRVWEAGRKHDVHHIDYEKSHCNDDNLITLCRSCNIEVNRNRPHWQVYFTALIKL